MGITKEAQRRRTARSSAKQKPSGTLCTGRFCMKKTAFCKPGSVESRHLYRPSVTSRLHRPTLRVGRATLKPRFIWFFNPWGFPSPASLHGVVSSYLAFSPLPAKQAVSFLWHSPWLHRSPFLLGSTALCVARTFLSSLRSSDGTTAVCLSVCKDVLYNVRTHFKCF